MSLETGKPFPALLVPGFERYDGRRRVLILLGPAPSEEAKQGLQRYRTNASLFAEQEAVVIVIGGGSEGVVEPFDRPAEDQFQVLPHPSDLVVDTAVGPTPTVYIIDEDDVVRATFSAERYPGLPNPVAVVRSLRRLADTPRPAPLASQDHLRGSPTAPVIILEYSDYQCVHCARLHDILVRLEHEFDDQVAIVHRHLPLRSIHPLAVRAAEAAEAAAAQDKFWAMHDVLFSSGGKLEWEDLVAYARVTGLDIARYINELEEHRYEQAIMDGVRAAIRAGIKATPTLFVNGIMAENARDEETLRAQIVALL